MSPPIATAAFCILVYQHIRYLGDRTIQENDCGKIQEDKISVSDPIISIPELDTIGNINSRP